MLGCAIIIRTNVSGVGNIETKQLQGHGNLSSWNVFMSVETTGRGITSIEGYMDETVHLNPKRWQKNDDFYKSLHLASTYSGCRQ